MLRQRLLPLVCAFAAFSSLLLALGACRSSAAPRARVADDVRAHYPGKLPQGVTPRMYDIHWTLDPNAASFAGEVVIAVDVREPHRQIYLHAEGLEFTRAWVEDADGQRQIARVVVDATPGLIALDVPNDIAPGMASLHFSYHAPYSSGLLGLYRTESAGQSYVFSQFEAVAARRAMPCFDEPRFKTPFQVRVTAPKDVAVIGNNPAIGEQIIETGAAPATTKTVSFSPTPPLPTYLLAVAVGPFDQKELELDPTPLRDYPLPVRILGAKGQERMLGQSLKDAAVLLAAHESYAELPYPFAKLDVLAVPDFGFGAMENAGLITFRDWLVLQDPQSVTYPQRRIAMSVLSHELTHQWFGNWVTMPWWDDLWLNEAFATWRGQKTAHQVRPHMGFDVELISAMGMAMHHDGLKSARRVREPCKSRDDITNAADVITYLKGAGLLTMAEHWLGSDKMTDGVRRYLAAHPFGTGNSQAFLQTIAKSAEEPRLPEMMQSFLNQPGAPEIDVALSCDADGVKISLGQDRYRPLGSDATGGPWQIPVCLRYGTQGRHGQRLCRILDQANAEWSLRGACPTWLVANAEGAGYYRVRYGAESLAASLVAFRNGHLSEAEQMAFLSNIDAQLESGALTADVALGIFAEGTSHEQPGVVAYCIQCLVSHAYFAKQTLEEGVVGMHNLLQPAIEKLTQKTAMLRAQKDREQKHGRRSEAAYDRFGQSFVALRTARNAYARHARDPNMLAQLSHAAVAWLGALEARYHKPGSELPLSYAAQTSDEDVGDLSLATACETLGTPFFDRVVEALRFVDGGEDRRRLIAGLGAIRTPALAERVRALSIAGSVHRNEVLALIEPQMASRLLSNAAWSFLLTEAETLMQRIGDEHYHRIIGMAGYRCDLSSANDAQSRFAPLLPQIPGGPRTLAQADESIRLCAAFAGSQSGQIEAWFAAINDPLPKAAPSTTQTTTRPAE